jgi:5-methylcytosine-specific restriction endonuclease McrA
MNLLLRSLQRVRFAVLLNQGGGVRGREEILLAIEEEIRRATKVKRSVKAASSRRSEKKATKKQAWELVRAAVLKRSDGACECCCAETAALECDHFFGGRNRQSLQAVETVWALCVPCHRWKTLNEHGAAHWLGRFKEHCRRYGYHGAARMAEARLDALSIQGRVAP